MKTKIVNKLCEIEQTKNIKILYACESGSRGWGFPSPDSDYDVRFIYLRNTEWYLSIDKQKDFIEFPISDVLDIGGWDLKKTLHLLFGSNVTPYEWLQSPIIYLTDKNFQKNLWEISCNYFSPRKSMHHYLGLAKRSLLSKGEANNVRIKTYFYILRPLLAAMWIGEHQSVPPMEFQYLLKQIENQRVVYDSVVDLLKRKETAMEKECIDCIPEIDGFAEKEIDQQIIKADQIKTIRKEVEPLNSFFRDALTDTR